VRPVLFGKNHETIRAKDFRFFLPRGGGTIGDNGTSGSVVWLARFPNLTTARMR
jgi:hypothetical protein